MGANDNGIEIPASAGRAYARRVILLEEACLKMRSAHLADKIKDFDISGRLRAQVIIILEEIGFEYLTINERVE